MNHIVARGRGSASRIRGRVKAGMLCSLTVLAAPAASTCGPAGPDITGTWATTVDTTGNIQIALGAFPTPIQTTLRLVITKPGADYLEKIELCKLATPNTTLNVTYPSAALQTMVATAPFSATPTLGGALPLPLQTIQTGSSIACHGNCVAGDFVDSDHDTKPGITLPANLAGTTPVKTYVALTIPVGLEGGMLTDANTINGNGVFSAQGQFAGSDLGIANGVIDVTTDAPSTSVTIKKIGAGDVPCAQVP
jgi:hypothetical protein